MPFRSAVRDTAIKLGLGTYVSAYQTARLPPMVVRDRRDMDHLRVLLGFSLRPDDNCIDVGANRGEVLEVITSIAPAGQHLAFEPLPDRAAELREAFPAVTVHNLALADVDGELPFVRVVGHDGYSGFKPQWYPQEMTTETITVEVRRLDDLLPVDFVPRFIKIDVEGAEVDVIAGAMNTIRKHQPLIVFEHFEGGAGVGYNRSPADVFDLLVTDAGMEIYDIDGVGPYSLEAMTEVFSRRELWTWVARAGH